MVTRRSLSPVVALVAMLLLTLAALPPATAAQPGNAAACKQGGWEALAPAEAPTVAFANQGDCVSYVNGGGQPVDLQTAPAPVAPGNSENAPGHDPNGPGNRENAPGHDANGPGNSENAPGHDAVRGDGGAGGGLGETPVDDCTLVQESMPGSGQSFAGYDLQGCYLDGSDLRGVDLEGANLKGASLIGADLSNANLKGANLEGANLEGTNLIGIDLSDAHLEGADLSNAELEAADLSGANLTDAHLEGANLTGADLTGADVTGVVWYNTQCPDGTMSYQYGNTCEGHLSFF